MEQYVTAAYANVRNVRGHMELVDDGCEGALGNTGSWCLGRSISIKYSHSLNGLGEILTPGLFSTLVFEALRFVVELQLEQVP